MRKHLFRAAFLDYDCLPRKAWGRTHNTSLEVETEVALSSAGIFGPWSRGSAKGLTAQQALEVHPHHAQWVELAGLVADGAAYAKARQSGAPRTRQIPSTAAAAAAEPRGSSSGPRGGSGRERDEGRDTKGSSSSSKREKEKGAERKKERSSSKKNKSKSRPSREEEGEGGLREGLLDAAAASEPATAAAAPAPAAGTASAGGGRWVHLPG